jgi:hypothetical protein
MFLTLKKNYINGWENNMILTNKYNTSKAIYDRIWKDLISDPYNMKLVDDSITCFRTTQMLSMPLPVSLWRHNFDSDDLVIDASKFLTTQFGTAWHTICEGEDSDRIMYEIKLCREFKFNGSKIFVYGTIDEIEYFEDGSVLVTDNKTCLMSNLGYDKPEYIDQLNVYLQLLRGGVDVINPRLRNRYFIKDWTPSKKANAMARASSPKAKAQAAAIPDCGQYYEDIPVYTEDKIHNIIMAHIEDHFVNPNRICTAEERWDTLPKVAVMLTGNKKAKKLCNNLAEAQQCIAGMNHKDMARAYTENREPLPHERDKNCQYYCKSASCCYYAKDMNYV